MQLIKFLSLLVITTTVHAHWVDFRCDASYCDIPYDNQGIQNGLEVCYKDRDKKEKIREVNWKNGQREGAIRCFDKGVVTREGNYDHGKLNGIYQEHKYDSRGTMVVLLKDGQMDGYQFHALDGKVVDLAWCYRDGQALEKTTSSCENEDYGTYKKALATYLSEEKAKASKQSADHAKKRNGPQIQTYRSGKKRATFTNVDGRMEGKYNFFSEEGILLEDCHYKKDKKDGECLSYDKEGRLDKKAVYKEDKVQKEESYFDNGKVSESMEKMDDKKTCFKTFFDSGAKQSSYCAIMDNYNSYYNNYRYSSNYDGKYDTWYENGQLSSTGQYENGKAIGTWESYDLNGMLYDRRFYEAGKLVKAIYYMSERNKNGIYVPEKYRIIKEFFPDGSTKTESELPGHDETTKKPTI